MNVETMIAWIDGMAKVEVNEVTQQFVEDVSFQGFDRRMIIKAILEAENDQAVLQKDLSQLIAFALIWGNYRKDRAGRTKAESDSMKEVVKLMAKYAVKYKANAKRMDALGVSTVTLPRLVSVFPNIAWSVIRTGFIPRKTYQPTIANVNALPQVMQFSSFSAMLTGLPDEVQNVLALAHVGWMICLDSTINRDATHQSTPGDRIVAMSDQIRSTSTLNHVNSKAELIAAKVLTNGGLAVPAAILKFSKDTAHHLGIAEQDCPVSER